MPQLLSLVRPIYRVFPLVLLLMACNERPIDTKKVKQEMKEKKIVRILYAEIANAADSAGRQISTEAHKQLVQALTAQPQSYTSCAQPFAIIADSLGKTYQASIKRLPFKQIGKLTRPSDQKETELLEAYQYNVANNIALTGNIQKAGETEIIYTSPIVLDNKACLNCHGAAPKSGSPELKALSGYKLSDPIGIYSVRLQKKHIIQSLSK